MKQKQNNSSLAGFNKRRIQAFSPRRAKMNLAKLQKNNYRRSSPRVNRSTRNLEILCEAGDVRNRPLVPKLKFGHRASVCPSKPKQELSHLTEGEAPTKARQTLSRTSSISNTKSKIPILFPGSTALQNRPRFKRICQDCLCANEELPHNVSEKDQFKEKSSNPHLIVQKADVEDNVPCVDGYKVTKNKKTHLQRGHDSDEYYEDANNIWLPMEPLPVTIMDGQQCYDDDENSSIYGGYTTENLTPTLEMVTSNKAYSESKAKNKTKERDFLGRNKTEMYCSGKAFWEDKFDEDGARKVSLRKNHGEFSDSRNTCYYSQSTQSTIASETNFTGTHSTVSNTVSVDRNSEHSKQENILANIPKEPVKIIFLNEQTKRKSQLFLYSEEAIKKITPNVDRMSRPRVLRLVTNSSISCEIRGVRGGLNLCLSQECDLVDTKPHRTNSASKAGNGHLRKCYKRFPVPVQESTDSRKSSKELMDVKRKVEYLVTPKFLEVFQTYAQGKDGLKSGLVITKTKSSAWLKRSGLYNSFVNPDIAEKVFASHCGKKGALNAYDYMHYLEKLATEIGVVVRDILIPIYKCPPPSSKIQPKEVSILKKEHKVFLMPSPPPLIWKY